MTVTEAPPTPPAGPDRLAPWKDRRVEWRHRWADASPTTRTRIQVGVFLAVVVVAYHYSLRTLVTSLSLNTPLAYVGLVPFIALGLAALRARPRTSEPTIHDRQLDYLVGLPLLATALALNLFLPKRLSTMFWVWRIDLLSLPFFVAGLTCIIFGVRAAWRQRLAIAYLLLAWPVPYSIVLLRGLTGVTDLTVSGLTAITHVIPWANADPTSGGTLFTVVNSGKAFTMSVASACSGVNGIVGFLLVGTAFGAIVRGPRLRKALWLAGGIVLLWAMNLGRLMLIFGAGALFGEHFAIKVLHPVVGLVTFNIGIVLMLLLMKPVGLRIPSRAGAPPSSASAGDPGPRGGGGLAVPRIYAATALVVLAGLVLAVTNDGLRTYDLVAQADGEPKLASFLAYPASPQGWKASYAERYEWAKPYFGEDSSWYRYTYGPVVGASGLRSNLPVVADVINTGDLSSFSAYGVEACYRFHGYSLNDIQQVDLGGGINGRAISYTAKTTDWSIVYWIWPVKVGGSTRYERVVLYTLGTGSGAPKSNRQDMKAHRDFLVAFAREVVIGQSKVPPGSRLPAEIADTSPKLLPKRHSS